MNNKAWLLLLLLLLLIKPVSVYGSVSNHWLINGVINCELSDEKFFIINKESINESVINGLSFLNMIIALSVSDFNNSYCFNKHTNDLLINITNYEINGSGIIKYNITNNQDKRLFYECRLISNCSVSKELFTGYINPSSQQEVSFNVTCSKGSHQSIISVVFVDELVNYHYYNKTVIINSV